MGPHEVPPYLRLFIMYQQISQSLGGGGGGGGGEKLFFKRKKKILRLP